MSLLTVSDVAAILGVHQKKVWNLIHSHALPAENITPGGGRRTWRIDPAELDAFRDRQRFTSSREMRRRKSACTGEVIEFLK